MRTLPVTVLAFEGPQARAYLVRLRRAGLRPERIVLMVHDPIGQKLGQPAKLPMGWMVGLAERRQDKAYNFHPRQIRETHPELVRAIADAMAAVVDDPTSFYREMYDEFAYDELAPSVVRVPANSYREPGLAHALRELAPATVVFTGGGIVPASVLDITGLRMIHVHTGFLPHVRGADVLLWSTLVRGRPGVSAFFLTPGLDEGDVLAAQELEPLRIGLPAADRPDDDTLYRAVFSFVDPLIRAELLVGSVLAGIDDPAALAADPQDMETGITYHFMHDAVRARALRMLFPATFRYEGPTRADGAPSPARYQRYYDKFSVLAPVRFTVDTFRAPTALRKRSLQNRQKDYLALQGDPARLALHARLNQELARQAAEWNSYDYGEGYYYQSSDELGITGLRDTAGRVEAFGLRELVKGRRVLEIGCNTGFVSLAIADVTERLVAFELNPHLVAIAQEGAAYLGLEARVELSAVAFEDFTDGDVFDDVLSFANHHTYDGNTRQGLEEYFARCHELTAPGGRLVFESHPPELEGDQFAKTAEIIERFFEVERSEVHTYGTFLDHGRRFLVARRRAGA